MKQDLQTYVSTILKKAEQHRIKLIDEKEINFGIQLRFLEKDKEVVLNIYYSKKKGITPVLTGKNADSLLKKIIANVGIENKIDHKWNKWLGTDESGKGDFFGPLVVCGFLVDQENIPELRNLGVKDSKLLKDEQVTQIAKKLYLKFGKQLEVIIIKPAKYNELYEQFRQQGKKLNELLAWMHARVILNCAKKTSFDGAVVDKFAHNKVLVNALQGIRDIDLRNRVKAERDIAVATASIISRYHFIKTLNEFSIQYNLDFPKGASQKVIEAAKLFANKFDKEQLKNVAKLHFKTYEKV